MRFTIHFLFAGLLVFAACSSGGDLGAADPFASSGNLITCYELDEEPGTYLVFEHGTPEAKVTVFEDGFEPMTTLGTMQNGDFVYPDGVKWRLTMETAVGDGDLIESPIDGLTASSVDCSEAF